MHCHSLLVYVVHLKRRSHLPKDQHVREQERYTSVRCSLSQALAELRSRREAKHNRQEHHRDSQTERSPHHGSPATKAIEQHCWEDGADDEHALDSSSYQ